MNRVVMPANGLAYPATLLLIVVFGALVSCGKEKPDRESQPSTKAQDLTEEQERLFRQLRSIGYAAGVNPAPERKNVTLHIPERCFQGLNLVVSGHAPEIILMDMDGHELHTWTSGVHTIWPDFDEKEFGHRIPTFFRRAFLLPDGELLAIFGGLGMVKLDRDSQVIWALENRAHHDAHVARDGTILVLTRELRILERYHPEKPILEDFVVLLDPQGTEMKRYSILELLENSPFARLTTDRIKRRELSGDIFHSNTIELVEDRTGIFKQGSVLISVLIMNMIFAADLERQSVYWAEFNLGNQHQPTLLTNGNVLVFQNFFTTNSSAVLEINPITRERVWHYGIQEQNRIFTEGSGSCQRLPNGNTLITESNAGRAIEVTAQKETVWEYINPERAGDNLDKIAQLFEVVRLPPEKELDWLTDP